MNRLISLINIELVFERLRVMNVSMHEDILSICQEIAKKYIIEAICIYGSRACGYARSDSDYDVLLILSNYSDIVRYHYKVFNGTQLAILMVDKNALESDAEKGSFGDFIVGRLLPPYIPLLNSDYLEKVELKTKQRFAEEDLEDLVIEYQDLARGLVVKPEYLVFVRMRNRARGYPPLRYSYINMLREDLRKKNLEFILRGYRKVLKTLTELNIIEFDEEIVFNNEYIDKILSFKTYHKVVNMVDFSKRALSAYLTHGKAGRVKLDIFTKELTSKLKRELQIAFKKQEIEDPKNYLFLKTEKGLINLNEKSSIIEIIQKLRNDNTREIKPLASALNEVFLLVINNEKLVVKKFTNWYNFKWFILNIAAYGTKIFSLSGKARLANEYGINRLLAEKNIDVPEIVAISLKDRVLVEKYVEGKSTLDFISTIFPLEELTNEQKQVAFKIGWTIGKIHSLDIVIGDCKPENFIIENKGHIYILDLEQGERKGDKTWDIAEFLYFSGHFGSTFTGGMRDFVNNFIKGYRQFGTEKVLKRAASFRYFRVFFGWTLMPIIKSIASILKSH